MVPRRDDDPTALRIEHGTAVVPDAEDAARHEDLAPEDPPADLPAQGDPARKPAVPAPVPAHGEMASREQLQEAAQALEDAGGGGADTSGVPTGDADTGRGGQGGTGQGTDDSTVEDPRRTAEAARDARRPDRAPHSDEA